MLKNGPYQYLFLTLDENGVPIGWNNTVYDEFKFEQENCLWFCWVLDVLGNDRKRSAVYYSYYSDKHPLLHAIKGEDTLLNTMDIVHNWVTGQK